MDIHVRGAGRPREGRGRRMATNASAGMPAPAGGPKVAIRSPWAPRTGEAASPSSGLRRVAGARPCAQARKHHASRAASHSSGSKQSGPRKRSACTPGPAPRCCPTALSSPCAELPCQAGTAEHCWE
eukprot:13231400-Alexandrium_andersonii.AAC.1